MGRDDHDYAKGTRARTILRFIFAPILKKCLRALLWLCPDVPIVANVDINRNGTAITIRPQSVGAEILNVRVNKFDEGLRE